MKAIVKNKFTWIILVMTILFSTLSFSSLTTKAAVGNRNYDNKYILEIDGEMCGFLKSVGGGVISAEVINEPNGSGLFTKKHIGQPKYEDITIEISAGMSKVVYEWISSMMTMTNSKKNGAIITCDFDMNSIKRLEFYNASITEVTFPAVDGAIKEESFITVKFSPEYYKYVTTAKTKINFAPSLAKNYLLSSNFRFNIDGLAASTSMTNKIDAVTITQTVTTDDIGDARDYLQEPGKLDFPNIVFTVGDSSVQPLLDWHNSFVVVGNNDESFEKSGYLEYLDYTLKTVLFRLDFKNLGIIRIDNDAKMKRNIAELYCERVEMKFQLERSIR